MLAKSYSDTAWSYTSSEGAINWNAPLVNVVNALQYYQTKNFK
ncbi:glycoside hydrolase family 9 protein [Tenacibaculum sp. SZ-18]|nr:glycoside hydrolase family 9 protein [Tenacibaculum sp. SZ-18]